MSVINQTETDCLIEEGVSIMNSGQIGIIAVCYNLNKVEIWNPHYFFERTNKILTTEIINSCYIEQNSIELDSVFIMKLLPQDIT